MVTIRFCLYGCHSGSLCLFWRESHTKGLSARSPLRPEVDEGREVPEKTERAVDKGGLKRTVRRREQKMPVDRTGQKRWLSRSDQSASDSSQEMSQHSLWLCGSFALIQARDSRQMHGELHKSATNSFLLRLELTQVCVCSFVLFFHPLGYVLCVCKEMCNAPGRK